MNNTRKKARRTALIIGAAAVLTALLAFGGAALAEGVAPKNGIPAVNLTIDPAEYQKVIESEDHSYNAEGCVIDITVPDNYHGEYTGEALAGAEGLKLEYFRGRGNATWLMSKKPFKIKLEKAADLLGMGENKHWVLLANAMDGSMIRNRLVSYIGRELGLEYTPEFEPVDFYVNGEYTGSYILGHQIRIDKNRVDIGEMKKKAEEEPAITGGYLLALEPYYYEDPVNTFTTSREINFKIDTPDFTEYDETQQAGAAAQRKYITEYLQRVEDALFAENMTGGDGVRYSELMDLDSAAKYWWTQLVCGNDDAYITPSTYLYKKNSGKLYWGPLWDFDMAFRGTWRDDSFNNVGMLWLDHMRAYDEEYQQTLRTVWTQLDGILSDITKENGVIDQYTEQIRASWEADCVRWPDNHQPEYTLEDMAGNVRDYLKQTDEGVNGSIDGYLTRVYETVTFMSGDTVLGTVTIKLNGYLTADMFPGVPKKAGYYLDGWLDQNGTKIRPGKLILGDSVLRPNYVRKKANTLKVRGKTITIRAGGKTKKTRTFKRSKALQITGAKGKLTFKKMKGSGKVAVSRKTGKVTVKKGLGKGIRKVRIRVRAAGTDRYKAGYKTVTVKVRVR
ncbi:MAG: CotH kinase family protein [Lachnospiraceae bacterium]|nr:CotH kinase family protein [Lachnospiraceae bacterium]